MTSPNAAFSIVHGERQHLPFNPVAHSTDVTEDFSVEISLLSAQFKTQNSAAAALDSSPTAAAPSAAGGAAAAASSTAPKKAKKPVDTSIYALPESSSKKCVFKNAAPGKASAAAITLSPDLTAEDQVAWAEGACVATFDTKFKQVKRSHPGDGARRWQQDNLEISVFQANATKKPTEFIKDSRIPLINAVVNLADFVSTAEPSAECVRQVTYTSHPPCATKFSLTLQVKTTPSNRHLAARAPKSSEQIASAASSIVGNAQSGKELLFKLAPNCSFASGTHVGIAEEEAWRGQGVMLLHTLSSLQACEPSAQNYFGQVTSAHPAAGCVAICVKCPEILKTKGVKTIQESRFGWRLLSACSSALKQRIDMRSEPYSSFAVQNEPIICIFPSGDAAEADDNTARQENRFTRMQAQHDNVTELKQRALRDMNATVQLSEDELGTVLLREGFLISQPLVSACMRQLIKKWYPATYDDECAGTFGSKGGPWSIRDVFHSLSKRRLFSKLLEELGYVGAADVAYGDRQQRRLEDLLDRFSRCLRHGVWRHFLLIYANTLQDLCRAPLVDGCWRRHRQLCRCAASCCRFSWHSTKSLETPGHLRPGPAQIRNRNDLQQYQNC
jgi:hypothetical protein